MSNLPVSVSFGESDPTHLLEGMPANQKIRQKQDVEGMQGDSQRGACGVNRPDIEALRKNTDPWQFTRRELLDWIEEVESQRAEMIEAIEQLVSAGCSCEGCALGFAAIARAERDEGSN
jgi:hypothetical protein